MEIYIISWLIIAALVASSVPIFVKFYVETNEFYWVVFSLVFYICLILAYYKILLNGKSKNITRYYTLIKIFSIILIFLISIVLFKEKLNIKTILAIILASIAIYLLQ
jgi:uncharacterized membrane protein